MDLSDLRKEIDSIDEQIVALINRRYELVHEVGKWKGSNSHEIYVPEREKALLDRLTKINKGLLPDVSLRAIYREIMSGALALEYPLSIAYLGPQRTFTHQAALAKFGKSVKYVSQNSIADVFESVERGKTSYGVIPVENSTEGVVTYTLDMFAQSECTVCAELYLPINHDLVSVSAREEISTIYSHPQALAQCRSYLHKNFPGVTLVEVASTAEAARRASEEPGTAAIASSLAAEFYQLETLEAKIEDKINNVTRFLVISRQNPKATGDDKTSLMFGVKDKVGALYECLSHFEADHVSLTLIESRPSKNAEGEYFFFLDFKGHISDDVSQRLLVKL
ncbi:MAG: prephenate dehydratase [Lentisphaeraceae bacterium]|nr:prephenate dehydratase [Lentisphaeraceae bacterium]